MTKLTTHVLDLTIGCPAVGMYIDLYHISENESKHLGHFMTDFDGRIGVPLLEGDAFQAGVYELVFHAGDYCGKKDFLDLIPIRFVISDLKRHYHVPLLLSAYGYSTYRGS